MPFWSLDNIRLICGGNWIARPEEPRRKKPAGVSIDSRTTKVGDCFIALRGERTDGHRYLADVARAGAAVAIVDRKELVPASLGDLCVLLVPDAGTALLKLGGAYRKTLETTKVIAVGGSNGKTTTTRLISAVLSKTLRGSVSPKSFNNAIGVPLTILGAKRSDQYLVCEVGTNAPGEIATLAGVVQPDIAVITSIGREHLEGLGNLHGVAQEEASLLRGLRPGGVAILTADSPELAEVVRRDVAKPAGAGGGLITFGFGDHADLRLTSVETMPTGTRFCLNDRNWYTIPLLGRHNASNATAAVAVARRLGVENAAIEAGLADAKGPEMRLQRERVGEVEVVNDAYNANPDSMQAALRTFDEVCPPSREGRRVAILGDMLELGEASSGAHAEIADAVSRLAAMDLVVFVGPRFSEAASVAERRRTISRVVKHGALDERVAGEIAALLRPRDRVLLKGSRGMGLERIVMALRSADPPRPRGHGFLEETPDPRAHA
jgi:UDP-N-acetylmuramoyl-tripeptide--D-alanyl-D-alanine ligase